MKRLPLAAILLFLFLIFVIFGYLGVIRASTPAYSLAGIALVFFVPLWAAGILGYKVGGTHLSLEKEVKSLAQDNIELKAITTTLVKILLTVMDGSYRVSGPTKGHEKLADKYIESISQFLDPQIAEQWNKDIADMRNAS